MQRNPAAKDQGFTPCSLVDFAKRNMKFRGEDLAGEHLAQPVTLADLKESWCRAAGQAEEWFSKMPVRDCGCLFLNSQGQPFSPDPTSPDLPAIPRHYGSLRGAWPKVPTLLPGPCLEEVAPSGQMKNCQLPITNCQLPILEVIQPGFSMAPGFSNWQLVIGIWQFLIISLRQLFVAKTAQGSKQVIR